MTVSSKTGLHATEYKTIDGLQIRFAVSEKKKGDPILLLSRCRKAFWPFFPPGICSQPWVRWWPSIYLHSGVPKFAQTRELLRK